MNMHSYNKLMEKVWAVVAILGFIYGAYIVGKTSLAESWMYLALPSIAAGLAFTRYYARKRYSNENNEEQ